MAESREALEGATEVRREVPHHLLDAIVALARSAPGVVAVVRARGRWTGRVVRLELGLRLTNAATIDDAIASQSWIATCVRAQHEVVDDILVRFVPALIGARS